MREINLTYTFFRDLMRTYHTNGKISAMVLLRSSLSPFHIVGLKDSKMIIEAMVSPKKKLTSFNDHGDPESVLIEY